VEWLLDTLAAAYARNEAPVVHAPRLGSNRLVFLFQTVLSNQHSQPVLADWFGIQARSAPSAAWESTLSLDETLETTGLVDGLSNTGAGLGNMHAVAALVPEAVERARQHANSAYEDALQPLRQQVREASRRLERWRSQSMDLVAKKEDGYKSRGKGSIPPGHEKRISEQRARIERSAKDHEFWIERLVRHGDPYVRLAAAFVGGP
jgi:hypothetical protein